VNLRHPLCKKYNREMLHQRWREVKNIKKVSIQSVFRASNRAIPPDQLDQIDFDSNQTEKLITSENNLRPFATVTASVAKLATPLPSR